MLEMRGMSKRYPGVEMTGSRDMRLNQLRIAQLLGLVMPGTIVRRGVGSGGMPGSLANGIDRSADKRFADAHPAAPAPR